MRPCSPVGGSLLLFAGLLLLPGPAARAGERESDEHPARRGAAAAAAARRITAFGNWCRGRAYKVLARQQYEAAIRLDPDAEDARAALGHRREAGAWKPTRAREDLIDGQVGSPSTVSLIEREMETAYREAAMPFAELGGWCTAEGRDADARSAWAEALSLDPGRTEARAALDLERADTDWLRSTEEGPAAFAARCRKAAEDGLLEARKRAVAQPDTWTHEAGAGGSRSEETRFLVTCTHKELPARTLIGDMIRTESLWRGAGVVVSPGPMRPKMLVEVFASREQFLKRIDSVPDRSDEWRAGNRNVGGCWPELNWKLCWGWDPEWIRESVAHSTTHFLLNLHGEKLVQTWIYEGAAVFATTTLRGRAEVICFSLKETAVLQDGLGRVDWDEEICTMVRRGEDPPIRELMAAGTNDMGFAALLKARSMVEWMVLRSPAAFRSVLANTRRGVDAETALVKAYGCPPEALERRWRLWIRRP